MEMYCVSKGMESYLDVKLGSEEEIRNTGNSFRIRMLEENAISGLISPVYTEVDTYVSLRYNTGSLHALDRVMEQLRPDGEFLKIMINQIADSIVEMEQHLLNPDDLVLNPTNMFYDSKEKRLKLICVPGFKQPLDSQFKSFLECVMRTFDHRDKGGISFLYGLYDKVCGGTFLLGKWGEDEAIDYKEIKGQDTFAVISSSSEEILPVWDAEDENETRENKYILILIAITGVLFIFLYMFMGHFLVNLILGIGLLMVSAIMQVLFTYCKEV